MLGVVAVGGRVGSTPRSSGPGVPICSDSWLTGVTRKREANVQEQPTIWARDGGAEGVGRRSARKGCQRWCVQLAKRSESLPSSMCPAATATTSSTAWSTEGGSRSRPFRS